MSAAPPPARSPGFLHNFPPGRGAHVMGGGALLAAYAPGVADLVSAWWNEPNYSHGFLVLPISVAILWQRKDRLQAIPIRPSPVGWLAFVGLLVYRAWLFEKNEMWTEEATIPLCAAAL